MKGTIKSVGNTCCDDSNNSLREVLLGHLNNAVFGVCGKTDYYSVKPDRYHKVDYFFSEYTTSFFLKNEDSIGKIF